MTKNCYVFDIDGTLADLTHRLHYIEGDEKDWDAFFDLCDEDAPIEHMCHLANDLLFTGHVVFVSGRSDRVRQLTLEWLDSTLQWFDNEPLYMRKDGDHRPDHIVKKELLAQLRADGYEPIMVFDDRKQVVDMWRAEGIPCAQVAEGDF